MIFGKGLNFQNILIGGHEQIRFRQQRVTFGNPLVLGRPPQSLTKLSKAPPLPLVTPEIVTTPVNTLSNTGFNTLGPIEGIKIDIEKPISMAPQDAFGPERVGDPQHDTSNSGWLSDILMTLSNGLTNFFNLLRPSESSSSLIDSNAECDKQVEAKLLKEHDHGSRSPIQNPTSPEPQPLIGILKTNINDSPPPTSAINSPCCHYISARWAFGVTNRFKIIGWEHA